jgi:transposase
MAEVDSIRSMASTAMGLDVGDRKVDCCVVDASGAVIERSEMPNTPEALRGRFEGSKPTRIALEAGTHSLWMADLLKECGHEVLVANPRKLRGLYENPMKSDRVDAEYLARVARLDPKLLAPVEPRSMKTQQDLAVIRSRDQLVQMRTQLVVHVRSMVKMMGGRIPSSISTESFASRAQEHVPETLRPAVGPILEMIQSVTRQIGAYEAWIKEAVERYPQTKPLQQISGVGSLTSLAFVLTVGDPLRFEKSRDVAAYFGLVPRRDQSGAKDPELRITKAGNSYVRRLLVGSAHYILGPFGPDTDLKRFGTKLAKRGDKTAKKKAVVAVARKLAVLLHRLWVTQAPYIELKEAKKTA